MAVFDGVWREVVVSLGRSSELVESTIAPDPEWSWLPTAPPHGTRLPVQSNASSWVTAAQELIRQGTVMTFDYCARYSAELIGRPWREWLRTYRNNGRGEHYLRNPGSQDITVQVCIDQLPTPSTIECQHDFLRRFGIDELVEEGRRAWFAAAARPDVSALTMRSRVSEAEALSDPSGLGAFSALCWRATAPSDHAS